MTRLFPHRSAINFVVCMFGVLSVAGSVAMILMPQDALLEFYAGFGAKQINPDLAFTFAALQMRHIGLGLVTILFAFQAKTVLLALIGSRITFEVSDLALALSTEAAAGNMLGVTLFLLLEFAILGAIWRWARPA